MLKTVILDRRTLGEDLDVTIDFDTSVTAYPVTQPHEAAQRIADADVVFVNKVRLDEENLKNARNLKLICEAATGYDNIDTDYCRKAGIAVCNVPGYSSHSVSQVTVGAVLYLANRLKQYTDFTASGEYSKSGTANCLTPVFHELYGKTWGIAGVGGIGSEVAKAAEALGCKVIAFKRTPSDKFDCVDIDTGHHKRRAHCQDEKGRNLCKYRPWCGCGRGGAVPCAQRGQNRRPCGGRLLI